MAFYSWNGYLSIAFGRCGHGRDRDWHRRSSLSVERLAMSLWILTSFLSLLLFYAVLLGMLATSKRADEEDGAWDLTRPPPGEMVSSQLAGGRVSRDRRVREGTAKDRRDP